jgi:hypothetical protein
MSAVDAVSSHSAENGHEMRRRLLMQFLIKNRGVFVKAANEHSSDLFQ